MRIAPQSPPHRSVRALRTHRAPTLDVWCQTSLAQKDEECGDGAASDPGSILSGPGFEAVSDCAGKSHVATTQGVGPDIPSSRLCMCARLLGYRLGYRSTAEVRPRFRSSNSGCPRFADLQTVGVPDLMDLNYSRNRHSGRHGFGDHFSQPILMWIMLESGCSTACGR